MVATGVPAGATLADDSGNSVISGGAAIDVSAWTFTEISVIPPDDSDDEFTITWTATATEANDTNDTADTVVTSDVTVTGVADAPSAAASNLTVAEDTESGSLGLSASLNDATNETLTVVATGVPAGATLADDSGNSVISGGAAIDVSAWTFTEISVIPPDDSDDEFTITWTATATEANDTNDTADTVVTSDVTVTGVADAPTAAAGDVTVDEDTESGSLGLSASLNDATNETLTVLATGVPAGATLADDSGNSVVSAGAAIDVSTWTFAEISVISADDSHDDFNITWTATATEANDTNDTADTVVTSDVTVTSINDDPEITAPATFNLDEDVSTVVPVSVIDPDADEATGISFILAITKGTLNVTASGAAIVVGNGTTTVTITGLVADVDATVATLTYLSDLNYYGPDTLTITANDGGNSGTGGGGDVVEIVVITVDPVNDIPTISTVGDQSTDEDTPVVGLAFTVDEDDQGSLVNEDAQIILVTGVSSNQSIVKSSNIMVTFTDDGTDAIGGTFDIVPEPNRSGAVTISIYANDQQVVNSVDFDSFVLTINPVNDTPFINDIADQITNEDVTLANIPFTVDEDNQGDLPDENVQAVLVTATSSDQALVLDSNVVVTFSDDFNDATTGLITIVPQPNATGDVTITVNIDDQQGANNTALDTFVLTITDINDAPVISDMADQSTNEDVAITGIGFTVDEDDQGDFIFEDVQVVTITATSSNQSVVPDANITVNFTDDANDAPVGSIDIAPAPHWSGSATITVTADDGEAVNNTVIDTFDVTVAAVNDNPTVDDQIFNIDENSPNGTIVGTVVASDIEPIGAEPAQMLFFDITGTAFAIDDSGEITVADSAQLDYELTTTFALITTLTDSGTPIGNDTATITININPLPDNDPQGVTDTVSLDELVQDFTFNVLDNDVDSDVTDPPTNPLVVSEVGGDPANVGLAIDLLSSGDVVGTLTVNADGSAEFDASLDTTVEVFQVTQTYTLTDGTEEDTNIQIIIDINPINDNEPALTADGIDLVTNGLTYFEDQFSEFSDFDIVLNPLFIDLDIDADGILDSSTSGDNDGLDFTVSGNTNGILLKTAPVSPGGR